MGNAVMLSKMGMGAGALLGAPFGPLGVFVGVKLGGAIGLLAGLGGD